jgi:nitrogen fixation/metabolism regulation signal transduction histidine kinase
MGFIRFVLITVISIMLIAYTLDSYFKGNIKGAIYSVATLTGLTGLTYIL